ncbi:MAG TPA: CPBP family intramembrane metalloprotease [Sporosarcina psychrophila]|uniref:CPBP family intramembrane metalloprotease n=1 Tax=Sporosarcina psychrophila TaxID=1476 RepID=A0A921KFK5_SPOPS|nr:CPBP family intramembrane metalloprotease [Sporosarcina psychrophila]
MKNWKIYIYLLVTYILMQLSSVYVAKGLFNYFPWNEQYTIQEIKYHASSWSLFLVNVIAVILFLLIILPKKNFFQVFKGKKSSIGNSVLWGFIGFFLALGGQMLAGAIEIAIGIEPGSDNTAILSDIAKVSPIIIICIVLFAPILEEIIFRRVIFGGIYQKTNFWIATIVSALVFAAVHNEFEHLLTYMMPAFVFAYLYYRTKRILTPMIAHLLMNGFVVILNLNLDKLQQMQDMKQAIIAFLQ